MFFRAGLQGKKEKSGYSIKPELNLRVYPICIDILRMHTYNLIIIVYGLYISIYFHVFLRDEVVPWQEHLNI